MALRRSLAKFFYSNWETPPERFEALECSDAAGIGENEPGNGVVMPRRGRTEGSSPQRERVENGPCAQAREYSCPVYTAQLYNGHLLLVRKITRGTVSSSTEELTAHQGTVKTPD